MLILRRNRNQSDTVDLALVMMVGFHWHWILYISSAISLELVLGFEFRIRSEPTLGATAAVSLLRGATLRSREGCSIQLVVFSNIGKQLCGILNMYVNTRFNYSVKPKIIKE